MDFTTRRDFLGCVAGTGVLSGLSSAPAWGWTGSLGKGPKITFYGSTQQVSGSCHIFECSTGLYVVDCGLFYADIDNHEKENGQFPFEPADVKALFLTHGHIDHIGRLPLLYEKGFRGTIYATDCTRDLANVMLQMSVGTSEKSDESSTAIDEKTIEKLLELFEAVPYNTKIERDGLVFRYTDAGHILGSAMVEVWIDGVKVIFGGDMGPDTSPILCKPTQHFTADAVMVESTYGPTPRDTISYEDFGERIMRVIKRGGSVLLPAFALHKTQCLIYIIQKLMRDKIIARDVPIFSDSSTAQQCTEIYSRYREYHDPEAAKIKGMFYTGNFKELGSQDTLKTHGKTPAIYISTSGMLDHAAAPKHLFKMAGDSRNAVFLVGYQAPNSVGKQLEKGLKSIELPWEERTKDGFTREMRRVNVNLQVEKVSGFSSHARGQQILEWLHAFEALGKVFVVHGDKERAVGLAQAAADMGLEAVAPKRDQVFVITPGERKKPGSVPKLEAPNKDAGMVAVDK